MPQSDLKPAPAKPTPFDPSRPLNPQKKPPDVRVRKKLVRPITYCLYAFFLKLAGTCLFVFLVFLVSLVLLLLLLLCGRWEQGASAAAGPSPSPQ